MARQPTNQQRAEWARRALQTFQEVTGTDRQDVYTDLLCDLMHLADVEGIDFPGELRKAKAHYQAESQNTPHWGYE